ncbi:hypothetical protein [Xanthomonas cucurbitae]|uniref:Glycosyl hydrolase family 32 N-terminal domain-containing protein n=1 Tax=Xanthomonas cucurbitae TaxID=56453 RepID=A0ABY7YI63_9XANT|nr:hypothetical protein [Xanthomonas cucurbitae]WDM69714.1 hypothetical protein K6981_07835 [Xanthomonas cucurbitae]WDM73588.1 hypothetical protein K6978_07805 [Xanthomonas cucurbitae]
MFAWTKRGLVFDVARDGVGGWMQHAALTPTPYRLSAEVLRIYAGFRDAQGVSRIGYVDVRADAPTQVIAVSRHPVLDIGRDGCFDDNGMILGDVLDGPDGLYMFYVGFQRVAKAKFLAFTGLAVSDDGGHTFQRRQETPLLDRAPGRSTIAAVHSARYEGGRWRLWYAIGDDWEQIGGVPYPRYHICYVETADLRDIPLEDTVCLRPREGEYRIGRPRVYRFGDAYLMYFTRGDVRGGYFPGVAFSDDGVRWERDDRRLGLQLSDEGWDAQTLCYPALIQQGERVLMFYNGNAMGHAGFGLADAALPTGQQGCHVFG